jgi:predicted phage terminase large subunit-like protein
LQKIAEQLEAVERGDIRRLILTVPPRHGKSLLTSQIFPAHFLGRNPRLKVMLSSHTQMLASDFGRNCRNFMMQPNFKLIFPNVSVSDDSSAKNAFSTNQGGEAFFMGVGGALLGRGADLAIIDDPVKDAEQADSETYIKKLRDWYRETLYTRQMSGGRIIIIMQRWRANDLIGWLLDPKEQELVEDWKVINFPAIAQEDDPLGREPGEALWPEKYPVEELNKIRTVLGSRSFNGLYQQKPSLTEGAIFKREWFHIEQVDYKLLRAPKIMYLDTAQKEGQANDYSAATWGARYKNGIGVLGATKGKFDFPRLIKWTEELSYRNRISAIVVEDKSSGTSLVQSLKKTSKIPVIAMKFQGNPDKEERAHAVTPLLESGKVIFDKWSPQDTQEDLFSSLLQFPTGSHDDDVDSLVGLLTYLSRANLKNVGKGTIQMPNVWDR